MRKKHRKTNTFENIILGPYEQYIARKRVVCPRLLGLGVLLDFDPQTNSVKISFILKCVTAIDTTAQFT